MSGCAHFNCHSHFNYLKGFFAINSGDIILKTTTMSSKIESSIFPLTGSLVNHLFRPPILSFFTLFPEPSIILRSGDPRDRVKIKKLDLSEAKVIFCVWQVEKSARLRNVTLFVRTGTRKEASSYKGIRAI